MERPALDAIEQQMREFEREGWHWAPPLIEVLAYCRKLEAENERLQDRAAAAEQVIHEELPS